MLKSRRHKIKEMQSVELLKSTRHKIEEMQGVELFVILILFLSLPHFHLLLFSASLKLLFPTDTLILEVNN